MEKSQIKRLEATVYGRVQGVGFRAFTRQKARAQEALTGWVKNQPDGTVKLVAEGPMNSLENLLQAVQQGPLRARVENLDLDWLEPTGSYREFSIKY